MSILGQIMGTLKLITYRAVTGYWAEKHLDECGGQLLLLFWWLPVFISSLGTPTLYSS